MGGSKVPRRKSVDATVTEEKELTAKNDAEKHEETIARSRTDKVKIVFELDHGTVDKRKWAHILAITYEGQDWPVDCLEDDIERLDIHPTWDELKDYDLEPGYYYDRGPFYEESMVERLFPPRPQPYRWMRSIRNLKAVIDAIKYREEYSELWNEIWTGFMNLLPVLMRIENEMLMNELISQESMPKDTSRSEWHRWYEGWSKMPWESHALVYISRRELKKMKAPSVLDDSLPGQPPSRRL